MTCLSRRASRSSEEPLVRPIDPRAKSWRPAQPFGSFLCHKVGISKCESTSLILVNEIKALRETNRCFLSHPNDAEIGEHLQPVLSFTSQR